MFDIRLASVHLPLIGKLHFPGAAQIFVGDCYEQIEDRALVHGEPFSTARGVVISRHPRKTP
jgi:hypothetical protein